MKKVLRQLESIIKNAAQVEIMSRFNQVDFSLKADGSFLTEADTAMQSTVARVLKESFPEFVMLGEEMTTKEQQALLDSEQSGLWVLDPLDGTSNFAAGIPLFSVSIALIQNAEVVLGVIYDPVREECFSAIKGQGAWLNGQVLESKTNRRALNQCIAQVDLKRLPKSILLPLVDAHPYSSQRNFGSGALDWCWVAADRSQLYIHGGQKLWDYVAGQLILLEAGGYACNFDKEPVYKLSLEPRSVIAATDISLFDTWKSYLLGS
jgi:myo-inositol-1(or 4)-monophosphatase